MITFHEPKTSTEGRRAMEKHATKLGFQEIFWSTAARTSNGAQTSWLTLWTRIPARRIQLDLVQDKCQARHIPTDSCGGDLCTCERQTARHDFLAEVLSATTQRGLTTIMIGDWNDELGCEALRIPHGGRAGNPRRWAMCGKWGDIGGMQTHRLRGDITDAHPDQARDPPDGLQPQGNPLRFPGRHDHAAEVRPSAPQNAENRAGRAPEQKMRGRDRHNG